MPGDTVRVTAGGVTEKIVVDNIRLLSTALTTTDVVVKGVAKYANGTPIPVRLLDNNEFRNDADGKFRADATGVTVQMA